MDWKNYNKNFNQQITMDFEWPNLDLIFLSHYLSHFLLHWYFFPLNMYVKELFKWVAFHMDFISWLITA